MTEQAEKTFDQFVLPASLVTKLDVSRLVSEVEWVDNELTSASVHEKAGSQGYSKPVFSGQLTEFLEKNQLNLDDSNARSRLIKELRILKDKVPVLHMTFAVPADSESLQKLADWVRGTVHPQAVIHVGLQPALVGGVYLRTPNHVHDLSLRSLLDKSHDILTKELENLRGTR